MSIQGTGTFGTISHFSVNIRIHTLRSIFPLEIFSFAEPPVCLKALKKLSTTYFCYGFQAGGWKSPFTGMSMFRYCFPGPDYLGDILPSVSYQKDVVSKQCSSKVQFKSVVQNRRHQHFPLQLYIAFPPITEARAH